jgi:TPR repeat protein
MRSLPTAVAALYTCAIASPSLADPPPQKPTAVVAVFEFRSTVPGVAPLEGSVRKAAQDSLPGAALVSGTEISALLPDLPAGCKGECAVRAGRSLIADLVVSGQIARGADAFVVSLELRETHDGELVGTSTANAAASADLAAAASAATADLFQPLTVPASAAGKARAAEPAAFAIGAPAKPEMPPALGPAPEGLVVDYDVDSDVQALYDKARSTDAAGADHPEDAAGAWNDLARASGENPFRELAAERAQAWDGFAAKRKAYESQQAGDSARLRKLLSAKWITEWVKLDLLERYARSYGADAATQTLPPTKFPALREKASLALACEAKDAAKCGELARLADEASEPRVAVVYLDRACTAGSTPACTDAGNRFLAEPARDVDRAILALQRGCDAKAAQSCARLARVYEEGETGKVDLAAAADLRDRACAAGDGASCRRLACLIDPAASAASKARAEELWGAGCAAGDAQSCALIRAAKGGAAPAAAVDEAAAAQAREYQLQRRRSLGVGLLAIGTVLGTAAAAMAVDTYRNTGAARPLLHPAL